MWLIFFGNPDPCSQSWVSETSSDLIHIGTWKDVVTFTGSLFYLYLHISKRILDFLKKWYIHMFQQTSSQRDSVIGWNVASRWCRIFGIQVEPWPLLFSFLGRPRYDFRMLALYWSLVGSLVLKPLPAFFLSPCTRFQGQTKRDLSRSFWYHVWVKGSCYQRWAGMGRGRPSYYCYLPYAFFL